MEPDTSRLHENVPGRDKGTSDRYGESEPLLAENSSMTPLYIPPPLKRSILPTILFYIAATVGSIWLLVDLILILVELKGTL